MRSGSLIDCAFTEIDSSGRRIDVGDGLSVCLGAGLDAGIAGEDGALCTDWLGAGVAQPMTSDELIATRTAVAIRWCRVISSNGRT